MVYLSKRQLKRLLDEHLTKNDVERKTGSSLESAVNNHDSNSFGGLELIVEEITDKGDN